MEARICGQCTRVYRPVDIGTCLPPFQLKFSGVSFLFLISSMQIIILCNCFCSNSDTCIMDLQPRNTYYFFFFIVIEFSLDIVYFSLQQYKCKLLSPLGYIQHDHVLNGPPVHQRSKLACNDIPNSDIHVCSTSEDSKFAIETINPYAIILTRHSSNQTGQFLVGCFSMHKVSFY